MNTHTLYFDWPRPILSANARAHWRATHAAKKDYKNACGWKAIADGLGRIDANGLHVAYTFFPPTRARFDLDNLMSRMKSATDAIAYVTGIDDHHYTFSIAMGSVVSPGMVKVDLSWTAREATAA